MTTATIDPTTNRGFNVAEFLRRHSMLLILAAFYVLVASTARNFMTLDNQLNILRSIAVPGIIAFGMTLLIIVGEIDLSVGSMVAVSGCVTAWTVKFLSNGALEPSALIVVIAMFAAMACAAAVGILNGLLRQKIGVPTFISSLAMMAALAGAANLITGGAPLESFPSWYYVIGSGRIFHVPVPVYLLTIAFFATTILSKYTAFGREIYAVGGNIEAARLSGINVWRTKTICLMLTCVLAAIGGIIISSLINSGNSTVARGLELEVISACIIGGVSLFGGKGSIWGTFVGVLFLGVLLNAMTLWGFNPYAQQVVTGVLILGAVFVNFAIDRL
ncbi:ABC transporter permease [Marinibacterium sp. SX1]|uniref:ABC transporter permease n=1 Tax=Marinibacterium sp. SX1 TaxID=3388424 RepID=UPI003D175A26